MIALTRRVVSGLVGLLAQEDSPRRMALGVSTGMLVGLVPKGNLLCAGLCLLVIATPVNLGLTIAAAAAFSLLAPVLDPLTHWIGLQLLTWAPLEATWSWLYEVPFVAWTGFNNTVVLGSFALGLALYLPMYWFSRMTLAHRQATRVASESVTRRVDEPAPLSRPTGPLVLPATFGSNPDESPVEVELAPAAVSDEEHDGEELDREEMLGRQIHRVEAPHDGDRPHRAVVAPVFDSSTLPGAPHDTASLLP